MSNFENPADNDRNNIYDITVTADDGASENNTATYAITIIVTDIEEDDEEEQVGVLSLLDNDTSLKIYGNPSGLTIEYPIASVEHVIIYNLNGSVVYDTKTNFNDNKANIKSGLTNNQIFVLRINNELLKFKIR